MWKRAFEEVEIWNKFDHPYFSLEKLLNIDPLTINSLEVMMNCDHDKLTNYPSNSEYIILTFELYTSNKYSNYL